MLQQIMQLKEQYAHHHPETELFTADQSATGISAIGGTSVITADARERSYS